MYNLHKTLLLLTVSAACATTSPCTAEDEAKITFDEHIKPIFREHCTACHSESDKSSDLALDSYGGTLAGGSGGQVVAEGNADGSRLWSLITHAEQPYMPPDQDPIPEEQRQLVKTWIEQGMPENAGSKIKRANKSAMAMLANTSVGKPEGPPPMPESLLLEPVVETKRSAAISAMAASPWAPLVAVGGQEQVSFYHTQTGELLGIVPFPEGEPQSLSFTRDGKQLLIGGGRHSHSGCAILVDVATGERITKVGDELDIVLAADISPDKSKIAIAGPQRIVRVFDSMSGDSLFEMKKHTDWVYTLRFSPDGVLLASGDRSNGLVVWEADTGRQYTELMGHKGEVRSLDFRSDSNVLASGSLDGTIKLWDMFENREIKSWGAHGGGVTAVMFAHDGLLASAGRDARVKLWNGNGELQKEFAGLSESALEVALTGDASFVAGGDWNGQVTVWRADDPAHGKMVAANPPSIDKRLAAAATQLSEVQSQHQIAAAAAQAATASATAAQQTLEQQRTAVVAMQQQLATATAEVQTSTSGITTVDAKIAELESQLAALRQEREQIAQRAAAAQQTVTTTQEQLNAATAAVATAEAKHAELATIAATSETQRQQLAEQLATAQAQVEKLTAAKAALDARAQELAAQAAASAELSEQLQKEAAQVTQTAEEKRVELEQRTQAMQTLQTQIAQLQQQLVAAQAAAQESSQQVGTAQQQQAELQTKLEEAQQAAQTAREQLELFNKSYK